MAQSIQRGLTRERDFEEAKRLLPSDIEMNWGSGPALEDIKNMPGLKEIFDAIEDFVPYIISATEILANIVSILQSVLQIIATVAGIAVDLFEAALLLVIEVLDLIKGILVETSINMMLHAPITDKERRTPSELLYDIGMSYLDRQDSKKPNASVGSVGIALVIMASLPNPQAVLDILNKIKNNIESLDSESIKLQRTKSNSSYKTRQYALEGSSGMRPDWGWSYTLADLPFVKKGVDGLESLIKILASQKPLFEKINTAINLTQRRINEIARLSQELLKLVSSLTALFALDGPTVAFTVYGHGTNEDFARAIINAPNHPKYPKSKLNEMNYGNYAPITAPSSVMAKSSSFSIAYVLHLQAGASLTSIELIKALWAACQPKLGDEGVFEKDVLASYIKDIKSEASERTTAIATAWKQED